MRRHLVPTLHIIVASLPNATGWRYGMQRYQWTGRSAVVSWALWCRAWTVAHNGFWRVRRRQCVRQYLLVLAWLQRRVCNNKTYERRRFELGRTAGVAFAYSGLSYSTLPAALRAGRLVSWQPSGGASINSVRCGRATPGGCAAHLPCTSPIRTILSQTAVRINGRAARHHCVLDVFACATIRRFGCRHTFKTARSLSSATYPLRRLPFSLVPLHGGGDSGGLCCFRAPAAPHLGLCSNARLTVIWRAYGWRRRAACEARYVSGRLSVWRALNGSLFRPWLRYSPARFMLREQRADGLYCILADVALLLLQTFRCAALLPT